MYSNVYIHGKVDLVLIKSHNLDIILIISKLQILSLNDIIFYKIVKYRF